MSEHQERRRMMKYVRLLAIAVMFFTGCSSGYRTEYCGCVPYEYCPPCPLPYCDFCGCHTPLAAGYVEALTSQSNDFVPREGGDAAN